MSRYPDIAPTISVDLGYGQYVDEVNFDVQGIADYLRDGGLSDEQILETNIVFSDKHPGPAHGGTGALLGEYKHSSKTATVYANYHAFRTFLCDSADDGHVDEVANRILAHELEHRVASIDETQQRINRHHHRNNVSRIVASWAVAGAVGAVSLANAAPALPTGLTATVGAIVPVGGLVKFRHRVGAARQRYLKRPEEIRCRTVEAVAPKLVNINSKVMMFTGQISVQSVHGLLQSAQQGYYANVAQQRAEAAQQELAAKLDNLYPVIDFVLRNQSYSEDHHA